MSEFRDLKKKLLAALCAFASGVSGVSANLGDKYDLNINDFLSANTKNFRIDAMDFIGNFDGTIVGAINKFSCISIDFGFVAGDNNNWIDSKNGCSFGIVLNQSENNYGLLNISLFHCLGKGSGVGNDPNKSILARFRIPTKFVADRLKFGGKINVDQLDLDGFLNTKSGNDFILVLVTHV